MEVFAQLSRKFSQAIKGNSSLEKCERQHHGESLLVYEMKEITTSTFYVLYTTRMAMDLLSVIHIWNGCPNQFHMLQSSFKFNFAVHA